MASSKNFEVGDLVWAKMRGYPFWPGEIIRPPKQCKKGHCFVQFYGSNNYASISKENIFLHDDTSVERYGSKSHNIYKSREMAVEIILKKDKLRKHSGRPEVTFKSLETKGKKSPKNKIPFQSRLHKIKNLKNPGKRGSEKQQRKQNASTKSALKESKKSLDITSKLLDPENKNDSLNSSENVEELGLSPTAVEKIIRDDYEYIIRNTPVNIKQRNVSSSPDASRVCNSDLYLKPPLSPQLNFESVNEALIAKNIHPISKKIGFLGLEKMGQGIVKNLLQSGHFVTVWDEAVEKCQPFLKMGACQGLTPADVVVGSDLTFCYLSSVDTIPVHVFEIGGVMQGLEKSDGDKGYIEMSLMEPEISQYIAEKVTSKGGRYLEVSLIGTHEESFEGSLLIIGAGNNSLFEDCRSCFDAMGSDTLFMGPSVGMALKLSNICNAFLGTVYASLAEALNLANRVGLNQVDVLKVLQLGLTSDKGIENKGHSMIAKKYASNVPLKHLQTSMQFGLTMGLTAGQPTLVLSAANEIYKRAKRLGFGDHDASAVYEGIKTYDDLSNT